MPSPGRTVLITGGAGRLGTAIAAAFRAQGAVVALADIDADLLAKARLRLAADGPAPATLAGDTSVESDVARIVDEAEALIGPLDALVTCAAVYPNVPLLEMEAAAWDQVFAVNLRGVMLVSQVVGRRWVARGTRGAMVHLSSGAGRSARRGMAAYCSSKAALNMLVEVLALELGPAGIRVNAVAPGLVMDTVVSSESADLPEYYNLQLRGTPLGRTGAPQDIADAVVFLASEKSAWTTGAILDVTGGSHCGRSHLAFTGALTTQRVR
jgi:NAD(P)-dependent dehydrogenase (short-subunit alcohol dehydrogenase family)